MDEGGWGGDGVAHAWMVRVGVDDGIMVRSS